LLLVTTASFVVAWVLKLVTEAPLATCSVSVLATARPTIAALARPASAATTIATWKRRNRRW